MYHGSIACWELLGQDKSRWQLFQQDMLYFYFILEETAI